ncbi:MAG TPA: glycosyltransferase family 4 protein [Caulobacteraceae bacterium]|nr:glycosyltransferase family 4 protein [Caulobacteraceae bacterium]
MIVLFVHQNFPGQYRHIARRLVDQGHRVLFITKANDNAMKGVEKVVYDPGPIPALNCHPFTVDFDVAVRHGMAVVETAEALAAQGVRPDVICGHCGWGELLFLKDVFPDVPILSYFEFYYHFSNVDVGFDPEFPAGEDDPFRLRARNAVALLSYDAVDWGNAPTRWQRSVFPPELRSRITVLHEGVDTNLVRPDPQAWIGLHRDRLRLTAADEVVTYVARNLEPYRGFHIFMRAAREILRRRPRTHVVVVGADGVSYGAEAPAGTSYRQMLLAETGLGAERRLHFLGHIQHEAYVKLLQVSSAHVYLTYPFVLSWSFIEAMAAGCAVIGSTTPPVMEVLKDGANGLAVDFFDVEGIADRVDAILDHPDRRADLRAGARSTAVEDFDLAGRQLPRWEALLDDMINLRRPPLDP